MNNPFLRVENICKSYGTVNALKNVSFSLERGQVLGLFGLNGSGKSTLMDIIALAISANGGKIYIEGIEVGESLGTVRRRIGYVPQEIALFEELTVQENLLCWSQLPGKKAKVRAEEVAKKINLTDINKKRISALSGGMKRRVNLAVALLGEPELLVLDEPFAGVDTDNIDGIESILRNMADSGVTQIVSGHSPDQLLPMIDQVMILSDGELIYKDSKAAFIESAKGNSTNLALKNIIHGKGL